MYHNVKQLSETLVFTDHLHINKGEGAYETGRGGKEGDIILPHNYGDGMEKKNLLVNHWSSLTSEDAIRLIRDYAKQPQLNR